MKCFAITLLIILLFFTLIFAAEDPNYKRYHLDDHCYWLARSDIDIKGSTVIITPKNKDGSTIKITKRGKLYLDGHRIRTDQETRELLKEYNHLTIELAESAEKFGQRCAQLGIEGAKIGLTALDEIFDWLCDDLEWEELEREIEKKARKLEKKATKLEDDAEELEELAENLASIREELLDRVPELQDIE